MRIRHAAVGLCCIPGLLAGQGTRGQTASPHYELSNIDSVSAATGVQLLARIDSMTELLRRRFPAGDSTIAATDQIRSAARYLGARWDTNRIRAAGTDPLILRRSLSYNVVILGAAAADESLANVAWVLRAVRDDMNEKADHCAKSPSGMATNVHVRVRTFAAGTESPNWRVFYLPKIMEAAKDPSPAMQSFSTFSSPTTADLPPGRYVMWASMPGGRGKTGERVTVRVGRGNTTMDQDLAVPAIAK